MPNESAQGEDEEAPEDTPGGGMCPITETNPSRPPARETDFLPGNSDTDTVDGPVSVDDAVETVRDYGGNITAQDERTARDIANQSGSGEPIRDNPHGPGQRPHYHPADAHGNRLPGHVFF